MRLKNNRPGINACFLKAHSCTLTIKEWRWNSIWASLECQCCFRTAGGLVSYLTMWLLTFQLFKNSTDTQENIRLNLHSLSVSVSELLKYRRMRFDVFTSYLSLIDLGLHNGEHNHCLKSRFPVVINTKMRVWEPWGACLSDLGILGSGATCKCLKLTAILVRKVLCMLK
jgi:hypothetical protein